MMHGPQNSKFTDNCSQILKWMSTISTMKYFTSHLH